MSVPGFLINGVTCLALNMSGNVPSVNDKFASLQIRQLKTSLQLLISDIGTKSSGEVFDGLLSMTRFTSSSEMRLKLSRFTGSLKSTVGRIGVVSERRSAMVWAMVLIFFLKNSLNFSQIS